nr:ribonuclease H [Ipomoea batatas]
MLRGGGRQWHSGFVGTCSTLHVVKAKCMAIMKDLEWAWEKGFRDVEIRSDSKEVVNCTRWPDRPLRPIVNHCINWMARDWNVTINMCLGIRRCNGHFGKLRENDKG